MRSIREMMLMIETHQRQYFHGSANELPVGTILHPRGDDYEAEWKGASFYDALERYRPEHMLAHKDAVFMVDNEDDIDLAGGATDWMFRVEPMGVIERHDLNWSSEVSVLVSENASEEEIAEAAHNYWQGVPHPNESVWEYLTPAAKIISVEPY